MELRNEMRKRKRKMKKIGKIGKSEKWVREREREKKKEIEREEYAFVCKRRRGEKGEGKR